MLAFKASSSVHLSYLRFVLDLRSQLLRLTANMPGETGPVSVSLPVAMTMAGFFAISCYNAIEINFSIFNTFKRRRGLYFWSMLVASWGIMIHAIAGLLRFFSLAPNFPMCVVIVIGWYAMVT